MSVRVVVSHRSGLVRDVLRMLAPGAGVHFIGEVDGVEALVELCRTERPAVVLTESDFLGGPPLDASLPELVATGARLVLICDDPSPERLTHFLSVGGVAGYLRSDAGPEAVLAAVVAVANGAAVLDPAATVTILEQWRQLRKGSGPAMGGGLPELTARETEVLAAMTEGLTTKAIAHQLDMALKTVENHKTRIFDKLGVRTQAAAVSYAIGHGLLTGFRSA